MINRIPVTDISPTVFFGGDFVPVKAIAGEEIPVSATIFREGHDLLGADVVLYNAQGKELSRSVMREEWHGGDRYQGSVRIPAQGDYTFTIDSYDHPFATWIHDAEIKIPADIDAELMCTIGCTIFEEKLAEDSSAKSMLTAAIKILRNTKLAAMNRFSQTSTEEIRAYFTAHPLRRLITSTEHYPIRADHERALVGSWYEFFPRSEGAKVGTDGTVMSGTFKTAELRLPAVAAMGFDILYLPPVHPIGTKFRKGKNNTLTPTASDPGVPWAIGNKEGGHDAINPALGTMSDFENFVKAAKKVGLEVAMDFALQASPDHPWATEHPEFFTTRPDGSIAYAENPPKKYQDIYPIYFDDDPEGIRAEVLAVLKKWIGLGVRIFRVDNPHTKPANFWQKLIAEIQDFDSSVIFLAEAFTRPAIQPRAPAATPSTMQSSMPTRTVRRLPRRFFSAVMRRASPEDSLMASRFLCAAASSATCSGRKSVL